jgi:prephenate dehydrogenase
VVAVCAGSGGALLAPVDGALGGLGAMRGAVASAAGLAATGRAGHGGRLRWAAARDPRQVRVRRGTAVAELREIGRRGDAVVGWA